MVQHWFSAKLALVVLLTGYQGWLGAYGKKLANGQRPLSNRAVRMLNEVPGIAAAIIVVLVIVRPSRSTSGVDWRARSLIDTGCARAIPPIPIGSGQFP